MNDPIFDRKIGQFLNTVCSIFDRIGQILTAVWSIFGIEI